MRLPQHAENPLHVSKQIVVTVGRSDAAIVGDDNRALQAAVDYVGALGGGLVLIGPGDYLMRDSLHLRTGVTVRGAGAATVLVKAPSVHSLLAADGDFGEAAITVENPAGFAVGGGVYVGSDRQRGFHGACATLMATDGAGYFTLSRSLNADLMVHDGAFAATVFPVISGYELFGATVEDLTIDGRRDENPTRVDGCRTAGIFLYRGDGVAIRRCVVRGYNGDGIGFQQSNDVTVEDCVVEGCGGLGFHPGSGSQRPRLAGNHAVDNDGDGLFFCWRVRGGVAEGNTLTGNGGFGLSIGHKDSGNVIRGNTIQGNRSGGVLWRNEDAPMAAHDNLLEGNTIDGGDAIALDIRGATDGTLLRGNTISGAVGVRIGERVGTVTLEGNAIDAATEIVDERR